MRNTLILLMAAAFVVSCGQKKRANISGTMIGLGNDTLLLEEVTPKERRIVDSAFTDERGNFRFRVQLPVSTPTFYSICHKGWSIPLLLSPGERVTVNSLGDYVGNYTVEGSPDSRLLKEFTASFRSGVATMDSLSRLYAQTRPGSQYDDRRKELLRAYSQTYLKFKREHITFIIRNATSLAAVYALYQRLPNDEPLFSTSSDHIYYELVADSLNSRYPTSGHVTALLRDVESQQKTREVVSRVNALADEQSFPNADINLRDIYDKDRKLSELHGKVILLDFWNAAEPSSGVLNAEYREVYEKFAPKGLEIYQVALGNSKAEWVNAVLQQRLPWISVLEPGGLSGVAPLSYRVGGVPSNVLFNKEGNIVGRNYYGAALTTKLAELTK